MPDVELNETERTYILHALAKQEYALRRYIEIKGHEEHVEQELHLLRGITEKLAQP